MAVRRKTGPARDVCDLLPLREDSEHGLRDPVDVGVGQFLVDGEFEALTAPAGDLVGKLGRAGGMRGFPQVHALHA